MLTNPCALATLTAQLATEASRFTQAAHGRLLTIVVADFEYTYDHAAHADYVRREGDGAERRVRWPFHRICAGAWAIIDFPAGRQLPTVRSIQVLDPRDADERGITSAFFAALDLEPDAIVVSWGAESKDWQVLRMIAAREGLVLPTALRDLKPYSHRRIDLAEAAGTRGKYVHLPEYAIACDIPTKAVSSKDVGPAALAGDWPVVREQAVGDIFTTAVIAARHLASHARVTQCGPAVDAAILEGFVKAEPQSPSLSVNCNGWAAHRRAMAMRQTPPPTLSPRLAFGGLR